MIPADPRSPNFPGDIAHYKILEKIGSGGMGDVYLAEDTKLDRKIALKVLPPEFSENDERRARFQREARAIAALDHPNIVQVFSVEEADGTHFITMQLVQGRTLTELLPKNGLSLDEFFAIAIPLADAVAAAHQESVVHRDLKPSNVMVADDGRVKVLDFGLALTGAAIVSEIDSESPTELKTREGALAGTLHFMSPEQADGKTVDHRTDIFSLGVIYYQMLTGVLPFDAETAGSLIAQILRDEPKPASDLNPHITPDIARIVRRCLAKPLDERIQSALDLRNELRDASARPTTLAPPEPRSRRLAYIGVGIAVGLALGLMTFSRRMGDVRREIPRLVNPRQVTFDAGIEDYPSWSPDGRTLAYHSNRSGNWDIWIVQADGGDPLNRTASHEGDDRYPAWSPDGQKIAFSRDDGIFVMSPLAGDPRRIASWTGNIVWSEDSLRIGYPIEDETGAHFFEIVDLETGESSRVAVDGADLFTADISWSVDERLLAFIEASSRDNDVTRAATMHLEKNLSHAVTDGQSKAWSTSLCRDSSCVYYVANRTGVMDLWRQQLDDDGAPVGEPYAMTAGVGMRSATFSKVGDKIAYSQGARISNIWRVPVLPDRPATWADAEQLTVDQAHIESVNVSRDGNVVLYDSNRAGNRDLWVLRLDTGTTTRLTTHPAPDWGPILSPDGTEVAFYSKRGVSRDVWIIPIEGGAARQITDHEAQDNVFAWSPDGTRLAYASTRSGAWAIWTVDRNGGNELKLAEGGYTVGWSPDGQWLAFTDFGPGDDAVVPPRREGISMVLARGGPVVSLTDEEGWAPRWSRDQKTIFFTASARRELWAVEVDSGNERAVTALSSRSGRPGDYALATDGRYLYFTWEQNTGDIWVMDVVTDDDS